MLRKIGTIATETLRLGAGLASGGIVAGFMYLVVGNTASGIAPTQSKIDFCTDINDEIIDVLSTKGLVSVKDVDRNNGVAKIFLETSYDGTRDEFDDYGGAGSYNCGAIRGFLEYDPSTFNFQNECIGNREKLDEVLGSFNLATSMYSTSGSGKVYFQAMATDHSNGDFRLCGNTFLDVDLKTQTARPG